MKRIRTGLIVLALLGGVVAPAVSQQPSGDAKSVTQVRVFEGPS